MSPTSETPGRDYKETLNLPRTSLPMKANLPQLELKILQKWAELKVYERVMEANRSRPRYTLHDGPPYANGNIHLGHALNKILKDVIVKYKNMRGFFSAYIPGWDCHGLPIELQVEKNLQGKKQTLPKLDVRRLCRAYAEKFIEIQREEFQRLGVMGTWERPYLTMEPEYEASELRELARLVDQGMVFRGFKPVHWCASCRTALAEAEVEYEDHTSPSIYVKFPVSDSRGKLHPDEAEGASFVIWTTTPWTLPANQAVALHPSLDYRLVDTPSGPLILAEDLVSPLMKIFGFGEGDYHLRETCWKGAHLEGVICRHPWMEREVGVVLGDFVTRDQGSGCVHIAPGHGQEDYDLGKRYGLAIVAPVDAGGRFTAEAGDLAGEPVFQANPKIIQRLRDGNKLLQAGSLTHSYPHCWRCKKPTLVRATNQWFVSMDDQHLRQRALAEIERVQWVPHWGKDRIAGMLQSRPDWCISRQRSWGLPLPFFYCQGCGVPLVDEAAVRSVSDVVSREGSDAWFAREADELLPPGTRCRSCGGTLFQKEEDILDVWFDSGASYAGVLERPSLSHLVSFPADLYLEGSDQHRGWFHSSLLVSTAARGRAPYRSVLTHGFTVDGSGRKMSKSEGNVLSPQKMIAQYGAEILRLWVASEDYRDDVRISQEILERLAESYRRVRNTARFLLGNLYDFDPEENAVDRKKLSDLDRWILHRTQRLLARSIEAYDQFEFHIVYHGLNNFCSVDLSALYLDIVKDRLYCSGKNSGERRSAQTALWSVVESLVCLMAPILSFTAEEIWGYLPQNKARPESVFLSQIPLPDPDLIDEDLDKTWDQVFRMRTEILKALEMARSRNLIGHSLDAKVVLYPDAYNHGSPLPELLWKYGARQWQEILIVSQVELQKGGQPRSTDDGWYESPLLGGPITVLRADGQKCPRCWNYALLGPSENGKPGVCARCAEVLAAPAEKSP